MGVVSFPVLLLSMFLHRESRNNIMLNAFFTRKASVQNVIRQMVHMAPWSQPRPLAFVATLVLVVHVHRTTEWMGMVVPRESVKFNKYQSYPTVLKAI